jgi:hypothetical protein
MASINSLNLSIESNMLRLGKWEGEQTISNKYRRAELGKGRGDK